MTIDQAGMQGGHLPPARDRGVAAGDRAGRRGPGEHPAGEQRHQALDPAAERLHPQLQLAVRQPPARVPAALHHRARRGHPHAGSHTEGAWCQMCHTIRRTTLSLHWLLPPLLKGSYLDVRDIQRCLHDCDQRQQNLGEYLLQVSLTSSFMSMKKLIHLQDPSSQHRRDD